VWEMVHAWSLREEEEEREQELVELEVAPPTVGKEGEE
jgi:hypothetical protein